MRSNNERAWQQAAAGESPRLRNTSVIRSLRPPGDVHVAVAVPVPVRGRPYA
jgi:hypothetical protein